MKPPLRFGPLRKPPGRPSRWPHSYVTFLDEATASAVEELRLSENLTRSAAIRRLVLEGLAHRDTMAAIRRLLNEDERS